MALENNLKKIPFSTEEIQELFTKPDMIVNIDVNNSLLKGEALVIYISNMGIKAVFPTDPALASEDKFEILKNFFTHSNVVNCSTLIKTASLLLLRSRGVNIELTEKWMSFDEMDKFIETYPDLLEVISNFLDSSIISAASLSNYFKNNILEPAIEAGEISVVKDVDIVSVNLMSLFLVPDFLEFFIAGNKEKGVELKYYKYQIEKFTYNQKNMFEIFAGLGKDSFLMSLVNLMFSEEKEEHDIIQKHTDIMGA